LVRIPLEVVQFAARHAFGKADAPAARHQSMGATHAPGAAGSRWVVVLHRHAVPRCRRPVLQRPEQAHALHSEIRRQQCGGLKDQFGVSWPIVPTLLPELLSSADPEKSQKVMQALLRMKKWDITARRQAAA